jgi:hypothetical protein
VVGTALGAIFGYLGGRAPTQGTVEGVQLQLAGQRAEAAWQAEVDACASFVDASNRALIKLGRAQGVAGLGPEYIQTSLDDLLEELREIQNECLLREAALLFRVPSTLTRKAKAMSHALSAASEGMHQWCAVRAGRTEGDVDQRSREALARNTLYGHRLAEFIADAQKRYSNHETAS